MEPWIPASAGMSARSMARSSMVKVRAGVSHSPVAEGNCVAARRGGEQPEANWRSVVKRTRFGGAVRRASSFVVKPGIGGHAGDGGQCGDHARSVVGDGTPGSCVAEKRGDPAGEVNAGRESEPSWY